MTPREDRRKGVLRRRRLDNVVGVEELRVGVGAEFQRHLNLVSTRVLVPVVIEQHLHRRAILDEVLLERLLILRDSRSEEAVEVDGG